MKRPARTIRCYTDQALQVGEHAALDKRASHHLSTVLRLKTGSTIQLFNGDGQAYEATIETSGKKTQVAITGVLETETESSLNTTLVQCISRGDKMDTSIQKATELGVHTIQPVYSRHSISKLDDARALKKMQHWQSIAISASEQSGRTCIPKIGELQTLNAYLSTLQSDANACNLLLSPTAKKSLANFTTLQRVSILIGPEAGLDQDEIDQAEQASFMAINFGPRILRTETAGPAVLAVVQALHGDLQC